MANRTFFVYTLVDPRDRQVRYVGQTVDPKRRLQAHMADIRAVRPNPKQAWIIELRSLTLKPIMNIVYQNIDLDDVTRVEQMVIDKIIASGGSLLNHDGVRTKGVKRAVYY